MDDQIRKLTLPQKTRIVGLFLSKFDREGIQFLGFRSRNELCNVVALALGTRPKSIRNYRDEFDPLFPNPRKGWNRPIRPLSRAVYEKYGDLGLEDLAALVKTIVYKNPDIDLSTEQSVKEIDGEKSSFARRATGQAAEAYFWRNHSAIPPFAEMRIEDTTDLGCGFDFRLTSERAIYAVEVKGIAQPSGNIALTDKEKIIASRMRGDYFLFVVKNLQDTPSHGIYSNPLESELAFRRTEQKIVQIAWTARIR